MKHIDVRAIDEADYPHVCLLEQGQSGSQYQAAVFVRQAMTLWPGLFLVAEVEDQSAGYLVGSISGEAPETSWILRVRVTEAMQRMGVATRMLSRIEESMKEYGINRILLSCSPVNEGALALYRKQGYTIRSREPAYFGPGEDRFILEKVI
nr:GNAT family N-acetyltransferase [uncultured Methanospirillum sp.]